MKEPKSSSYQRWPSRLRDYQKSALSGIARYLAAEGDQPNHAALVRLPTGSGKTAIIGVATTLVTSHAVLVVTPARALRRQMLVDLRERLWLTLKLAKPDRLVLRVLPRDTTSSNWDTAANAILATTDHTLAILWRATQPHLGRTSDTKSTTTLAAAYAWLRQHVGLVLVDEGHREPAETWSQAVRALGRPTVLFSATPYRNDTRQFQVSSEYAFGASWRTVAAHRDRPLRDVVVKDLEYGSSAGSAGESTVFADALLRQLRATARGDRTFRIRFDGSGARVIVRCDSAAEVRAVAEALAARGQSVVQIHHQFDDRRLAGGHWQSRDVPLRNQPPATFWIHEDKLIEGIDDRRFRVVAFFHPPSTQRSIIQQIGRVVRNPQPATARERAYVLAHRRWGLAHTWFLYKRAEGWDLVPGATPMPPSVEQLVDEWLKLQAPFTYVFGRYRAVLSRHWQPGAPQGSGEKDDHVQTEQEPESPPPQPSDVRVPLTARIRVAKSVGLTASELIDEFVRRLPNENGAALVKVHDSPTHAALLYTIASASELLEAHCFGSLSLECAVAARVDGLVFWYDSRDRRPEMFTKATRALRIDNLQRLFPKDATPREATARNIAFGDNAIRRRVILAPDLNQVAEAASDFSFTCSTVLGSVPRVATERALSRSRVQRYLGFSRGRITESGGTRVPLPDYFSWLTGIAEHIGGKTRASDFFKRYAIPVPEPVKSDTIPAHVILDVQPSLLVFDTVQKKELPIDELLSDRGVEVGPDGTAILKNLTEDTEFAMTLEYNDELQRYEARGAGMDRFEVRDAGGDRPLLDYLTHEQRFRILTTKGLVFVDGHFARSRLEITGRDGALTRLVGTAIHRLPELADIRTEKGRIDADEWPRDGVGWPPTSLFCFLDQQLRRPQNAFKTAVPSLPWATPTWVICDDIGPEIADFVVLSSADPPQVTLVHAKVPGKVSLVSATALQEVVGQAQKNASAVSEFSMGRDTRAATARAKWATPWTVSSGNGRHTRAVRTRLRLAPRGADATQAWEEFQRIAKAPGTRREVWIVCPRGLAYDKLSEEVAKPKASPELVQLAHLLLGVRSAVGEHAGSLRVFCA